VSHRCCALPAHHGTIQTREVVGSELLRIGMKCGAISADAPGVSPSDDSCRELLRFRLFTPFLQDSQTLNAARVCEN